MVFHNKIANTSFNGLKNRYVQRIKYPNRLITKPLLLIS
jgi:hypothetical protein